MKVRALKDCAQCGKSFAPRKSTQRWCSLPCNRTYQAEKWAAYRGTCEICGKALRERHAKRFCSPQCHGLSIAKPEQLALGLPKRTRPSKVCAECGERFSLSPSNTIGRRWCSRACYRRANPVQYDEAHCAECGIPFRRRQANMRQSKLKFCSPTCSKAYFRGELSPAWRGGSNPNRGAGWLKRAEEVRERDGRTCRRCGKSEADNGEKLSVDHLIPWRTFDTAEEANQLDNLVSLCRHCHTLKTQTAERKWLKGDVLAMQRHIEAITLPSAAREDPLGPLPESIW